MACALFVSNGHGEAAIAARIARDVHMTAVASLDHLALVKAGGDDRVLHAVGPTAKMPSGGLVAMGNVRAFLPDLAAGFVPLFASQLRFLRVQRGYTCVVAVGDAYALAMALLTGRPTLFVGTAKSVYVAGYGPFERTLLRRARRIFVRDEPTAAALRAQGVAAEAPGNVIVDLLDDEGTPPENVAIGVLPGSRESAYRDGVQLARVIRAIPASALFSLAPGLDTATFARLLAADGWVVTPAAAPTPFRARDPRGAQLTGWSGSLGGLIRASRLILGQAGTANEAAAAHGVPVVALATSTGGWYRMRQQRLLGEALVVVPEQPEEAAAAIRALLGDARRLERMSEVGRQRMGEPGGARVIAQAVTEWLS
ncbi:MAG TPA: hypothetical protein VME66_02780 [Candidatus Acidoferrales bacterium]|nr:hypothetical protein [Candidatus Acidoferrales bacterium]